jgi:hypothetical protein
MLLLLPRDESIKNLLCSHMLSLFWLIKNIVLLHLITFEQILVPTVLLIYKPVEVIYFFKYYLIFRWVIQNWRSISAVSIYGTIFFCCTFINLPCFVQCQVSPSLQHITWQWHTTLNSCNAGVDPMNREGSGLVSIPDGSIYLFGGLTGKHRVQQ